jgi:hypothetical protein
MVTGTEPGDKKRVSGYRKLAELVGLIAASTLVMFLLSSIALLIYTNDSGDPVQYTLDVPPGSSTLIAAGENPLEIPPTWTFNTEDTLRIENRDDVTHTLGDWTVSPGTIETFELLSTSSGTVPSTLHPSGFVTLDVQPRDFVFSFIAYSTFGFGLAIGIILFIGLMIARALDHDEDEWQDIDASHRGGSSLDNG